MNYAVYFSPNAKRQIEEFSKRDQRRVATIIDSLSKEPRPVGAVLCRKEGLFKGYKIGPIYFREIGPYKIHYEVKNEPLEIVIASILIIEESSLFMNCLTRLREWFWSRA